MLPSCLAPADKSMMTTCLHPHPPGSTALPQGNSASIFRTKDPEYSSQVITPILCEWWTAPSLSPQLYRGLGSQLCGLYQLACCSRTDHHLSVWNQTSTQTHTGPQRCECNVVEHVNRLSQIRIFTHTHKHTFLPIIFTVIELIWFCQMHN